MTIDAAQRDLILHLYRSEFVKWAKATGVAEQCGLTSDELLESVEFTIQEPVLDVAKERDLAYDKSGGTS